jgi:hypothetical protein
MGLDQYFVQSTTDADVLNTLNSIIDINFESGQIVECLVELRGYHSLHDYVKGVVKRRVKMDDPNGSEASITFFPVDKEKLIQLIGVDAYDYSSISNETFIPITTDDLIPFRDFCKRWLMGAPDCDEYYVRELEVEGIYEGLNEVLGKVDSNLKLYYYESY